jgi:hypothetical protein
MISERFDSYSASEMRCLLWSACRSYIASSADGGCPGASRGGKGLGGAEDCGCRLIEPRAPIAPPEADRENRAPEAP